MIKIQLLITEFDNMMRYAVANTPYVSLAKIVYSLTSGSLFYNQDGATAGFGTGGEFAVLGILNSGDLTANDFVIIA